MSLRTKSETYAYLLEAGLVEPGEVVAWADRRLLETENPDPALIEVSLSASDPNSLLSALHAVPGAIEEGKLFTGVLSGMATALARDTSVVPRVARLLYSMALDGRAPDEAVGHRMMWFDDAWGLAVSGTHGSPDEVLSELRRFLQSRSRLRLPED